MTPVDRIFVHLTDTHIMSNVEDRVHGIDTAQSFRDVLSQVRSMQLEPSFFVISGDLANHGEPAAYAYFRQLLEEEVYPFNVPVFMNLGNHDNRPNFRAMVLGEELNASDEKYYYAANVGDVRVIMLDSLVPGAIHGEIGREQLDWLDALLDEPIDGGNLLAVHHPPVHRGVPRKGEHLLTLRDNSEFAEVIKGRPVLGILSGHTHVPTAAAFAGTINITAAATAFLGDPASRDGGATITGAGFNICTIRDGSLVVNPFVLEGPRTVVSRYTSADLARHAGEPVAAG